MQTCILFMIVLKNRILPIQSQWHSRIRLYSVLLLWLQPFFVFSQKNVERDSLYPNISRDSVYQLKQNRADSLKSFLHQTKLPKVKDPLEHIENVGFRFIVRELAGDYKMTHRHRKDSVRKAVNTLLQYVGNDSIRNMVFYLKDYIENRETEEALKQIKKQIEREKILSYQPDLPPIGEINLSPKASSLQELYKYIENDPVHQWIREISRDSVLFGVKNFMNDSIQFWVNNGKQDFKRFWLKKNNRDSIGVWIQNTPGRSVRILVDEDVYQHPLKSAIGQRRKKVVLERKEWTEQYKLAKLKKYKRYSKSWSLGATTGLFFNQGHVSESWSRGGESSIAISSTIDAYANYKKGNHSWDNSLRIKYGLLRTSANSEFRKNEDRIELNSKYGQKAVKNWYYSAQFNLKTQIAKGYSYPSENPRVLKSKFFAPAYLIGSIGMDYKPNRNLSILLSPLSAKYTIVSDTAKINQTAYGVAENENMKKELGCYVNVTHSTTVWEDLALTNKLTLYSNYREKQKNIDVDWEMSLSMPINQYLSTKLLVHLISDDDTGSKLQFKENFSIGFSYRFVN